MYTAQWLSTELLSLDPQRQQAPSTEEESTVEESTVEEYTVEKSTEEESTVEESTVEKSTEEIHGRDPRKRSTEDICTRVLTAGNSQKLRERVRILYCQLISY